MKVLRHCSHDESGEVWGFATILVLQDVLSGRSHGRAVVDTSVVVLACRPLTPPGALLDPGIIMVLRSMASDDGLL